MFYDTEDIQIDGNKNRNKEKGEKDSTIDTEH